MIQLEGQRVVVMGLGRFGGGVGAARFCAGRGARVLVTDLLDADRLADSLARLEGLPIDLRLGEHREADFTDADLVVANPAVRVDHPALAAARDAGVAVTTEVGLLIDRLPDRRRVIGVTGTAGKSTTVAMIGSLFADGPKGRVHVGGNLGGSLLHEVDRIGPDDRVVLELSSFMLEHLAPMRWSPGVAVVTNLAPNHLDWHGDLDAYRRAKRRLLDHQQPGDTAVLGASVADWPTRATRIVVDRPYDGELSVVGRHNRLNAAFALAAFEAATQHAAPSGPTRDPQPAMQHFRGLPHRLQFVAEHDGVRFFNDSKSTTPEAAMLAIDAFEPGTAHAILGGYDKQSDLTAMARHAAARCAAVYTIGQTGEAVAAAADSAAGGCGVVRCGTLERAVDAACGAARPGQVVLLSPGCASWDQFTHFEQRGERFVELVRRYVGAPGAARA